jgi:hypothetical protein
MRHASRVAPVSGGGREDVALTEAEREALTEALASAGCWDHEECCWRSFEAAVPVIERIIAAREAAAEQRGRDTIAAIVRTAWENGSVDTHVLDRIEQLSGRDET